MKQEFSKAGFFEWQVFSAERKISKGIFGRSGNFDDFPTNFIFGNFALIAGLVQLSMQIPI